MGSTAAGLTHQLLREMDAYRDQVEAGLELEQPSYFAEISAPRGLIYRGSLDHALKWEEVPLTQMDGPADADATGVNVEKADDKLKTPLDRLIKFLKILLPHIGLTVVLLLYVAAGAAVFRYLEADAEVNIRRTRARNMLNFYHTFVQEVWDCSAIEREDFLTIIRGRLNNLSEHVQSGVGQIFDTNGTEINVDSLKSRWTFQAAVLYALTVLTTTGYDHVTPQTDIGKLFAVFFGLVGIPLMFITAADIGKFLSEIFIKAWRKFVDFRRELFRRLCCRSQNEESPDWREKDMFSDISSEDRVGQIELPVFAYFGLILLYCAVGGFLYTSWEKGKIWTFLHAFHFSFNTITTIGLGNIEVHHALYLCLIVAYVIIGLAVVTMCVDLASSQLKILFSKIHYFGRKMRGARYAFANMSDDLREAMRVIAAIRRHRQDGKPQITAAEIRRYLEQETQGGRLQRPFIPQNIHVIKFVDDEDQSSVRSSASGALRPSVPPFHPHHLDPATAKPSTHI